MDLDDLFARFGKKAEDRLRTELKDGLILAIHHPDDFVRECAEQLEQALRLQAQGRIGPEDVQTLLAKQRILAQLEAGRASIERRARIQQLCIDLIDKAVEVVVAGL